MVARVSAANTARRRASDAEARSESAGAVRRSDIRVISLRLAVRMGYSGKAGAKSNARLPWR